MDPVRDLEDVLLKSSHKADFRMTGRTSRDLMECKGKNMPVGCSRSLIFQIKIEIGFERSLIKVDIVENDLLVC